MWSPTTLKPSRSGRQGSLRVDEVLGWSGKFAPLGPFGSQVCGGSGERRRPRHGLRRDRHAARGLHRGSRAESGPPREIMRHTVIAIHGDGAGPQFILTP